MQKLGWSDFGLKNSSRESGHSYTTLSPIEVIALALDNWNNAIPGAGETDLSRKILIPVPVYGFGFKDVFFCPPRIKLTVGLPLKAEVKVRQTGEDPFIETYVDEDDAKKFGFCPEPASKVEIVCYSAEALTENSGHRSDNCEFEIVTILASKIENVPMLPLAMSRNYLEKSGGTKSEYTALEFAEAIYYHSTQKGVAVRLKPNPEWVYESLK